MGQLVQKDFVEAAAHLAIGAEHDCIAVGESAAAKAGVEGLADAGAIGEEEEHQAATERKTELAGEFRQNLLAAPEQVLDIDVTIQLGSVAEDDVFSRNRAKPPGISAEAKQIAQIASRQRGATCHAPRRCAEQWH